MRILVSFVLLFISMVLLAVCVVASVVAPIVAQHKMPEPGTIALALLGVTLVALVVTHRNKC